MATDIYVKAGGGSDGGEGTQGSPYEHISFALGRIANPLTDVTTIHLTSNGTAFTETNGIVSFRNIKGETVEMLDGNQIIQQEGGDTTMVD